MGRVRLKIKRLENNTGRQATYSKRKNGIMKKANELSILCDVDIVLLMFSPGGKPTLYKGKNSNIEEMIEKLAQVTPQERAKRQLESLEALKKTFKKLDHDVNIEDFLGPSYQSVEDLTAQTNLLRTLLTEVQKRLRCWTNLDRTDSIEDLGQMEVSLSKSLNQIRTHKENLGKEQQMDIQCADQLENGMHLPFSLGMEQQLQPLSWIPNDNSQHMVLPNDLNLLPQRDTECSAGNSFGSYSGFFGAGEKVEITKIGQENGILDELSRTKSLSAQLYEQHPYPYESYNFSLLYDKKFQPAAQMNMQENTLDYGVDRKCELPQSGYDPTNHSWASTFGTCAVAMFDEHLYPQQHYSSGDHVVKDLDHIYVEATHHPGLTN